MKRVFIFEQADYKTYIRAYSETLPRQGYGFRSRIAEAIGCKTAYVAQVLAGDAHFSLEQAADLSSLLQHNEDETEFFLLMVQVARAGTERLRRLLRKQMATLQAKQLNLKERFKVQTELSEHSLIRFFSRWVNAAVHLATTIPALQTRKELMQALNIEASLLDEVLEFLFREGLLEERNGKIHNGSSRIFIGRDSPILKLHHANWRQKAISNLDLNDPKNLHFTSLFTLSTEDADRIRENLIREIESVRELVHKSPEQEMHLLSLDFFRVDRGT